MQGNGYGVTATLLRHLSGRNEGKKPNSTVRVAGHWPVFETSSIRNRNVTCSTTTLRLFKYTKCKVVLHVIRAYGIMEVQLHHSQRRHLMGWVISFPPGFNTSEWEPPLTTENEDRWVPQLVWMLQISDKYFLIRLLCFSSKTIT